jgi:hypothetical protein
MTHHGCGCRCVGVDGGGRAVAWSHGQNGSVSLAPRDPRMADAVDAVLGRRQLGSTPPPSCLHVLGYACFALLKPCLALLSVLASVP